MVVTAAANKDGFVAFTTVDSDKYLGYRCFGKLGKCVHAINFATEVR